jgi:hypothetical protein
MDRAFRRLAVLSLAAALTAAEARAERVLQTWHPWQLDSVLVAWALTQAISPPPVFESVARGTPIAPESAIDTPDSPYRRTGRRTAFDEAVRLADVKHECVPRLREAVRVVELAPWRKPEFPAVEVFEARVLKAIPQQPARGGLEAAMNEIERYCREGKTP